MAAASHEHFATPETLSGWSPDRELGMPGTFPFTRGIQPTMYRGRLWTMRQYAGFGTAAESNQRYRYLLSQGVTGLSVARDWGPQYFYSHGWKAFSSNDYVTSQRYFEWAIRLGGETNTAADATFFRAASLLRQNKFAEAMAGYEDVVRHFENSIWVAESEYHVGLCLRSLGRTDDAVTKFQYVIDTYPGNRWAGFAQEQLGQIQAERARSAAQAAQPH